METKITPTTWNAGQEFNKIIGEYKTDYQFFHVAKEWKTALDILSIDFDLTYIKILSEAKKQNNENEVQETAKKIRKYISETDEFIAKKKLFPQYHYEASRRLSKIRRKIWDLQGKYGVLFPYHEEKNKDPRRSMRDGFK